MRYKLENIETNASRLEAKPEKFDYEKILKENGKASEEYNGLVKKQKALEEELVNKFNKGEITEEKYNIGVSNLYNNRKQALFELNTKYNGKALKEAGQKEAASYRSSNSFNPAKKEAEYRKEYLTDIYSNYHDYNPKVVGSKSKMEYDLSKNVLVDRNGQRLHFNSDNNLNNIWQFNDGKIKGLRDNAKVSIDRKTGQYKLAKGELDDAAQLAKDTEIEAKQKAEAIKAKARAEQEAKKVKTEEEQRAEKSKILETVRSKNTSTFTNNSTANNTFSGNNVKSSGNNVKSTITLKPKPWYKTTTGMTAIGLGGASTVGVGASILSNNNNNGNR